MDKVVEAVVSKQGDMNDNQFAAKLGLSRTMWVYLKKGDRKPGKKFYQSVKKEYPDLMPLIMMEM